MLGVGPFIPRKTPLRNRFLDAGYICNHHPEPLSWWPLVQESHTIPSKPKTLILKP